MKRRLILWIMGIAFIIILIVFQNIYYYFMRVLLNLPDSLYLDILSISITVPYVIGGAIMLAISHLENKWGIKIGILRNRKKK